jgi:hypothetical protein
MTLRVNCATASASAATGPNALMSSAHRCRDLGNGLGPLAHFLELQDEPHPVVGEGAHDVDAARRGQPGDEHALAGEARIGRHDRLPSITLINMGFLLGRGRLAVGALLDPHQAPIRLTRGLCGPDSVAVRRTRVLNPAMLWRFRGRRVDIIYG